MNLFSPAEMVANYSVAGAGKATSSLKKLVLMGILAGMLIGIPCCVTNMASYAITNNSTVRLISGILFAFGLGMVVMTGAELFTGNTLISISVLDKKATVLGMLRNWLIVYASNFIGSLFVAFFAARFGWLSAGSNALAVFSMKLAIGKMTMSFPNAFVMGVFCNILVTLGVLLSLAGKDGISRVIGAWGPVMFFVVCGFNHSIADMTYCMLGLFAKNVPAYVAAATEAGLSLSSLSWGQYVVGNMIPVTLGNIVGGVLVGCIFYFAYLQGSKK